MNLAALSGIDLLSLDYRLAPESPFPIAIEQAEDALSWLSGQAEALRLAPGKLAVMGDSAGGNLAAVLARRSAISCRHELACQVLLDPMTDVVSPAQRFVSRVDYGGGDLFLEKAAIQAAAIAYTANDAALRSDRDISPLAAPVPEVRIWRVSKRSMRFCASASWMLHTSTGRRSVLTFATSSLRQTHKPERIARSMGKFTCRRTDSGL